MSMSDVELVFGVSGDGELNGASGKIIAKSLTKLAKNLEKAKIPTIKIHFDEKDLDVKVKSIREKLQKSLNLQPIKVPVSASTSNSGTGNENKESIKNAQQQVNTFKEVRDAINKAYQEQAKFYRLTDTGTMLYNSGLEKNINNVDALNARMKKYIENANITEPQKTELSEFNKQKTIENMALLDKRLRDVIVSYSKAKDNAIEFAKRSSISASSPEGKKSIKELQAVASEMLKIDDKENAESKLDKYSKALDKINKQLANTKIQLSNSGDKIETIGQRIRRAFTNKAMSMISGMVVASGVRALKQLYENVISIETAMSKLQMTTKITGQTYVDAMNNATAAASRLGVKVEDLISSTTDFARLGYSLKDASIFAELTTMYSNVADVNVNDATRNITAIIKAYDITADKAELVLDKLIAVGDAFAISPAELGEGMNNAASALAANGNSLEQAMGILTAANTTLQNISKSSTAVRTITARISASTAELEELGEETNILSTANLDKKMKALGVAITDNNGELRSTFEILNDLNKMWSTYDSTTKAAIADMMAGTRQQTAFYSIMDNWKDATSALDISESAGGTLDQYYDIYLNTTQGKINQLKAMWQEFSNNVLDSSIIKFIIDLLKGIASGLNWISGIGDGILVTIPLIIGGLVVVNALIKKIAATTIFTTIKASLVAIWTGLKGVVTALWAQITARKTLNGAIISNTAATNAGTVANNLFNLSNPVGWIVLAVGAIVALGVAIAKYTSKIKQASEASENAKEKFEEAREKLDNGKESIKDLVGLIDEYKQATEGLNDDSIFNSEIRQKVLDIQTRITKLVGDEADKIDLVNDKLSVSVEKLQQLKAEEAKQVYQDALGAYAAAKDSSNKAYVTSDAGTGGFDFFGLFDPSKFYQMVLQRGGDASKYAEEVYNIIAEMDDRILISKDATIGDKFYGINFKEGMSAGEMVNVLNEVIDKMVDQNIAAGSPDIYSQFVKMRDSYKEFIDAESGAVNEVIDSVVSMSGFEKYAQGEEIKNVDDYKKFKEDLLNAVNTNSYIADMLKEGTTTAENVQNSIDNWLSTWYSSWYDKANVLSNKNIIGLKSFLKLLTEIQDEYDLLSKAMDDMDTNGILSPDTVEELLNDYPELVDALKEMNALIIDSDGYKIKGNTLDEYLESLRDSYDQQIKDAEEYEEKIRQALANGEITDENELSIATNYKNNAIKNRENLEAVLNTLERTKIIEEFTTKLEEQSDSLEEQKDKYKDIISIRKKLLESYEEELNYQKQLADKQRVVADLETKLALSSLDNSASGQAKTRELQAELDKAQDELSEYTLEHAINDLTAQLDSEYDEYDKFISEQIDSINETINKAAEMTTDAIKKAMSGDADKIPSHHSGGFVGSPLLKNNEEFAKLLNGELVVTPQQMSKFMGVTLPALSKSGMANSQIVYNSPLVSIRCDNITKDSIPKLQEVVNEAVSKVKKEINSALSRTGKKGNIDKFSI